jgi:predicted MPP superfamily phosphohydrolase
VRILLVSDLHYTLPQLDWVVRSAPRFDLVVLAGDQLDISSTVSLDAQAIVILRYLALLQAAGKVVIGSGNHDLTAPMRRASSRPCGSPRPAPPACRPTATL